MRTFKMAALAALTIFGTLGVANAAPSTADIDVSITDILILTNIGSAGSPAGVSTPVADAVLAAFPGISGTAGGTAAATTTHGLLQRFAGISEIASAAAATYFVQANADTSAVAPDTDNATSGLDFGAGDTVLDFDGAAGGGANDPLTVSASAGAGSLAATSTSAVTSPFQGSNLQSSSAIGLGSNASSGGQSSVTIIDVVLDNAAIDLLIGVATTTFEIGVYMDVITAALALTSDGPGSLAQGDISMRVEIRGFDSTGLAVDLAPANPFSVIAGGDVFGVVDGVANGTDRSSIATTGAAAQGVPVGSAATALSLATGPVVTASINRTVVARLQFLLALNSNTLVRSNQAVPEPGSIALLCLGGLCVGVPALRRRRSTVAAA